MPELPKALRPLFSGVPKEWESFYENFSLIIHSEKEISEAKTLNFLRTYLAREARLVVGHILAGSSVIYNSAWELMCMLYSNKSKIFTDRFTLVIVEES